jgi:peptidoglycan/xylan/chitin deacetylase (PgdA/CDA1 family)
MMQTMNPTHILSKSRGTRNLLRRIGTVLCRFGVTSNRFENTLTRYYAVTRELDCVPTLPITAKVLERHSKLIKELSSQGIEFAVHGYIHIDYGVLSLQEQLRHFKKAIYSFESCHVPFTGFRAPFLRINEETTKALGSLPFHYDSSYAINWDVLDKNKFTNHEWNAYNSLLDFNRPRKSQHYLSLPKFVDGFVEIPVSFPDDEGMVDRLEISDSTAIADIWKSVLQKTYNRGELFTISLHPERISLCENALIDTLRQARQLSPVVWVTALGEIAEWWKRRATFTFKISPEVRGKYRVQANCSNDATILLKNCTVDVPVTEWANGYQSVSSKDFILESPKYPVIGVNLDSSQAAVNFLKSEGFAVERSEQSDKYSIYLNNLSQFQEADEKSLSERIERADAPLLRYWRWPDHARSALSVTGDIDSVTLIDFVLRIFENWRQNWRQ